jgi:hypothetical protein
MAEDTKILESFNEKLVRLTIHGDSVEKNLNI